MKIRLALLLAWLAVTFFSVTVTAQKTQSFKLEPLSPKFSELIGSDAMLETVATGFGFTEGPMWDPAGFLYVSDETINKIIAFIQTAKKKN
jgi:gluconolactonase